MNVYHNPSCSKSRLCLEELTSKDMTFEVIHYLKNPLNRAELTSLLNKLDMNPSELVRRNEVIFKEASKIKVLTEDDILQLMLDYPKLIERPIVEVEGKAIVARPIERLDAILTSIK